MERAFLNGFLSTYTAHVSDLAVLPDGRIVVVFGFNVNNADGIGIGATRVLMLDASGSRITTFPVHTSDVRAVAVDSQGQDDSGSSKSFG